MLVKDLSDNWAAASKEKNREVFSKLDVLLRALDRFFNIENQTSPKEDIANKNFFPELTMANDVILRILGLLEVAIPEGKRNVYWFQKFAVTKYLNDKKRDAFREKLYKQDIPEKSLLLLYDSFINLKGIITDILKTEHILYLTFAGVGQIIGKDIRENVHFNPFTRDLNPEFDVIENRELTKTVKAIKDREVKKSVSVALLYLFRFLRYLRFADSSNIVGSLSCALLVILLLRSEIALFRAYLDKISGKVPDDDLKMLMRTISYQFAIEAKRVYQQEFKNVFGSRDSNHIKGKIENSHGILKNLTEQSIIQIVQFFKPDISGNEIFESFTTKLEQSVHLREDLLILHNFLTLLEERTAREERLKTFEAMRNFMLYFQSFTFRLLRYDDYEEFNSFFDRVLSVTTDGISERNLAKLMDRIRHFRIFVHTCLRHLSNRSELAGRPPDKARVEASLRQYLH